MDSTASQAAKELIVEISSHFGPGIMLLAWADGASFADQFGLSNKKKDLPVIVLESKEEPLPVVGHALLLSVAQAIAPM